LDHVAALAERYAALAASVRAGIDTTAEAGDADTADILTGVSEHLDKALWMLEATAET
jgi:starvation-inducible DNA-binding protein